MILLHRKLFPSCSPSIEQDGCISSASFRRCNTRTCPNTSCRTAISLQCTPHNVSENVSLAWLKRKTRGLDESFTPKLAKVHISGKPCFFTSRSEFLSPSSSSSFISFFYLHFETTQNLHSLMSYSFFQSLHYNNNCSNKYFFDSNWNQPNN